MIIKEEGNIRKKDKKSGSSNLRTQFCRVMECYENMGKELEKTKGEFENYGSIITEEVEIKWQNWKKDLEIEEFKKKVEIYKNVISGVRKNSYMWCELKKLEEEMKIKRKKYSESFGGGDIWVKK